MSDQEEQFLLLKHQNQNDYQQNNDHNEEAGINKTAIIESEQNISQLNYKQFENKTNASQDILQDSKVIDDEEKNQIQKQYDQFKLNYSYLALYTFTVLLGNMGLGFLMTCNNQVGPILDVQFNLTSQHQENIYNTFIGSSAIMGATIGSLLGGKLLQYGRRKVLFAVILSGCVFVIPTLFLNVYLMILGRLLQGICGGVMVVFGPRMLEETIPTKILTTFAFASNMMVTAGQMIADLIGGLLPQQNEEEMMNTNLWRLSYAFPFVFFTLELILLLLIIREEPLNYMIQSEKDYIDDSNTLISKVYSLNQKNESFDYQVSIIKKHLKNSGTKKEQSSATFKDALFGSFYWRATWFTFLYLIFVQYTGVNAIMFYSNTILQRISQGSLTPQQGTLLLGSVNFMSACFSIIPARYVKRRPLLIFGHFGMSACMFLLGFYVFHNKGTLSLIMMLLFLFVFQQSAGAISWIYAPEVVTNAGLGFVFFGFKLAGLAISLTTEFMMDSTLQPYGCFWLFSGLCFISGLYVTFLLKETQGLADRQKKELYKFKCGSGFLC